MESTPDHPWWVDHPEVLEDALRRIRDRAWVIESMDCDAERELVELVVGGLASPPGSLSALLPPGYPTVPPSILSESPLLEHIHPVNGLLCLPEDLTDIVDLLDAAVRLYAEGARGLDALRALGTGAAEPRAEYLKPPPRHAVSIACTIPAAEWGNCSYFGVADDTSIKGAVVSAGDNEAASSLLDALTTNVESAAKHHQLIWWRTTDRQFPTTASELMQFFYDEAPEQARKATTAYEYRRSHPGKKGRGRRPRGVWLYGLVVPEEGPGHDEWHERLIVLARRNGRVDAIPTSAFDDIGARIPGADALATKTVAVAGLGMLGGNIALDLARTGVGSLRLGDHETVELGNLVRQPYELNDVGERKVDVLRRHIQGSAPACWVDPEHLVGQRFGQTASRTTTRRWLEGVDLLIMTTGDHLSEVHLCDVAHDLGVPVVSGWVSPDLWGCATLSTRRGQSGCRWCLDKRDDLLAQIAEPPDAAELYTRGCGHPTFRGDVVDGRIAASIVGRTALDVLLGSPSQADFITTELRSSAGRTGPTTTYSELPPNADCPICAR